MYRSCADICRPNSKTVVPASINLDDDKLGDEDTPLPGGIDLSSDTHVDLLIEHPSFLSDKHWANLEKIIDKIDGGLKKVEAQYSANGDVKRKIVICEFMVLGAWCLVLFGLGH